MPITIPAKVGDTFPAWTVQAKKQDPTTDLWVVDNLSDVTAIVANLRNTKTGELKVAAQAAVVDNAALGLMTYNQVDADVDTAGLYRLDFVLTRGGKTETKPNDDTNTVYVDIRP